MHGIYTAGALCMGSRRTSDVYFGFVECGKNHHAEISAAEDAVRVVAKLEHVPVGVHVRVCI